MRRQKATTAQQAEWPLRVAFTAIDVVVAVLFGLGVCWLRGYPGDALGDARMAPYWVAIYVLRSWACNRWSSRVRS